MTARTRTPPKTNQMLSRWVDAYARKLGQDVARIRRWVAYMALGGTLERAGFYADGPRFTIKGGVALELRLRSRARATRDLDLILNDPNADPISELDAALAGGFEAFSFRRHGEGSPLPRGGARVEVTVEYARRGWSRIQIDLSRREGESAEFEMVEALDLRELCFDFPERLPCLSLYAQAAQKIHAMTLPASKDRPNERFRDLVDLLLLTELIADFASFRKTCERVFASRELHAWPPFVEAHEHWAEPFARMAEELGLPIRDLHTAVYRIRSFLHDIDPRTPLFRKLQIPSGISATTWYYLVNSNDQLTRLASGKADALLDGNAVAASAIPESSRREQDGLVLLGVVVILRDQTASWIERVNVVPIALEDGLVGRDVALGPEVWRSLALEVQRRTKSRDVARESLAKFLSSHHGLLPTVIGRAMGFGPRYAHVQHARLVAQGNASNTLWDLAHGEVIEVSNTGTTEQRTGLDSDNAG